MRKRLEGKSVKTAYLGLLLALAVIFGYIEALIPVPVPIPGIKLGLANLVIAAVLYFYGPLEAMTVTVLRVLIIGFLFGNMFFSFFMIIAYTYRTILSACRVGCHGLQQRQAPDGPPFCAQAPATSRHG